MGASEERVPSVIAAHVDITYRVYGQGGSKEPADEDAVSVLKRLLATRGNVSGVGMREVRAVRDVSFVAYRGEAIGIVGRNGSGKSTLLRSIAGMVPPTSGQIWINGTSLLLGVGAMLMPRLTGRQNIEIGCLALGMSPLEVRTRMQEIIDFADIGQFIDMPMSTYSSGMGARLRFAISTAVVPDVLVVDEALATGDAEFKHRADERIDQIREKAGTIFMVSHSESAIRNTCDRALWMDKGQIVMDGTVHDVVEAYSDMYGKKRRKRERGAPDRGPG